MEPAQAEPRLEDWIRDDVLAELPDELDWQFDRVASVPPIAQPRENADDVRLNFELNITPAQAQTVVQAQPPLEPDGRSQSRTDDENEDVSAHSSAQIASEAPSVASAEDAIEGDAMDVDSQSSDEVDSQINASENDDNAATSPESWYGFEESDEEMEGIIAGDPEEQQSGAESQGNESSNSDSDSDSVEADEVEEEEDKDELDDLSDVEEIDRILKHEQTADGTMWYYIRWVGHGKEDDLWIREEGVNAYAKEVYWKRVEDGIPRAPRVPRPKPIPQLDGYTLTDLPTHRDDQAWSQWVPPKYRWRGGGIYETDSETKQAWLDKQKDKLRNWQDKQLGGKT